MFSTFPNHENCEVVSFNKNFSPASKDSGFSNSARFNSNGNFNGYNYARDTESSRIKKKKPVKNVLFGSRMKYRAAQEPYSPNKRKMIGLTPDSLNLIKEKIISSKDHSLSGDKRKGKNKLKFDPRKMNFNKPGNSGKKTYSFGSGSFYLSIFFSFFFIYFLGRNLFESDNFKHNPKKK
jgi:hypothetical protein